MFGKRNAPVAALAGLLALAAAGPAAGQSYLDQIGYTALKDRLGGSPPTGAGVPVAQIEAQESPNAYLPDRNLFPNTRIIDRSGGGLPSNHARVVGNNFYGPAHGLAPGVPEVNAYKVDGSLTLGDWLGGAYLRLGTPLPPVEGETYRVQNHSWALTGADPNDAPWVEALRRLDFAVRRDNVVAVVGLTGGGPIPALLGNSYNAITVGVTTGASSTGPTTGDGTGRSKPDIVAVASDNLPSYTTGVVSGAAALLVETANGKADPGERARAGRVETIKAALLSGATKEEFAALGLPWQRMSNGSFVEPLDRRFGAGELNIDRSHMILSAPEQTGTDVVSDAPVGWDFETLTGTGVVNGRRYLIDVPADQTGKLSATTTWHRRVTQELDGTFTATLSRVELRLFEADAAGNPVGPAVDASLSPIDNVQHLYADLLPGRRYAIEVTAAAFPVGNSEDVATAWYTAFAPVPEPGWALAAAGAALIAVRFRKVPAA